MLKNLKKFKELLLKSELVSSTQLAGYEQELKVKNIPLEELLTQKNIFKDEELGQLIAEVEGYNFINLRQQDISRELVQEIPEVVATKHLAVTFGRDTKGLKVAVNNPQDKEFINLLHKRFGPDIVVYYATKNDITEILERYTGGLTQEIQTIINKHKALDGEEVTVELVNKIITAGYNNKASDIHLEPNKNGLLVRFRIDGILHDILTVPKNMLEAVISRLKIMAKLRTDEHRAAQDGKIRYPLKAEKLNIRISILPITEGEKIVLRLLSEKARRLTLVDLGLSGGDLKKVEKNYQKAHGMILATGPTGCGKTTTLYSILLILNKRSINISTIEDPVEYDIEGVNQIQVNPKTNLTFSSGLRSIVRQDPDIIMVGEIRDKETAGIAINAAMTGHLVLSTLHTNDAATTLPRLIDMGIEPFLVSSTINVIVAQRLVRRICPQCITSRILSDKELEEFKRDFGQALPANMNLLTKGFRVYQGKGCKVCGQTGYTGRIGIFEVLELSDKIKDLILARAYAEQIEKQAKAEGMTSMLIDGFNKISRGITTIEEVLRVVRN